MCNSNPCQNGGTCHMSNNTCVCPDKYVGLHCEIKCPIDCICYGIEDQYNLYFDIKCVKKTVPWSDIAALIIKMNKYKPLERMWLQGYDERVLNIFKDNNLSSLQSM
ncbi:uncharacterized protein [Antedon mediterranea]|uniref:uncharacterized protein n=1 Tax=Antedon mediterranea TaxID=105859 RepID=UPI003AF78070